MREVYAAKKIKKKPSSFANTVRKCHVIGKPGTKPQGEWIPAAIFTVTQKKGAPRSQSGRRSAPLYLG